MNKPVIYALLGIAVCGVLASFQLATPQCEMSKTFEDALVFASLIAFFTIMFPLAYWGHLHRRKSRKYAGFIIAVFFIVGTTTSIGLLRAEKTHRNYWQFEGPVEEKFISNNRSSKSIVVSGKEYEFIPKLIWDSVSVGEHIQKGICGNIFLNGREFEFAP